MRRVLLYGFAAAALLLPAGACSGMGGSLVMGVRFPGLHTLAIPTNAKEIRVGVAGANGFSVRFALTAAVSTRMIGGVPVGSALVGAVAFDDNGEPLAGGRATAIIRAAERSQAVVVLAAGAVDPDLIALVGRPGGASPAPSDPPTASPSAPASPDGPASGDPNAPAPATTPVPTTTATPVAETTPAPITTITQPGGGAGGLLATPTPTPTPIGAAGAGVTVTPGTGYTGPVTIL
jgi:hypothetical protein